MRKLILLSQKPTRRLVRQSIGQLIASPVSLSQGALLTVGLTFSLTAFSQANTTCGDGLTCQSATPIIAHELHTANISNQEFAYQAVDVTINKRRVTGDEPLLVSGRLVDNHGKAVAFVSAKVVIGIDGFEIPYQVNSDGQGYFSLTYRVSGAVTGKHDVSVIHPNSFERPKQVSFTAVSKPKMQRRVGQSEDTVFTKELIKTGVSFADSVSEVVKLKNQGTANTYNIKIDLTSADGFTWGSILSQTEKHSLSVQEEWPIELRFAPPSTFNREGTYQFTLTLSTGTEPNIKKKSLPIKVSVTTNQVGGYTFTVNDIYTNYSGRGGNSGVKDARIRLTRNGVPVTTGTNRTDINGQLTYTQLPIGFYDYQISADKHTTKNGEIYVRAGVTKEERILLDIPVVKVDWSVTETVIEDKYDIVVDATYETDVPQPVIVIEPAVVKLPAMKYGDVVTGALKITNKGLVSLDDIASSLPQSDNYINYTFQQDALPGKLLPMQTIYLPYRLQARRDLKLDSSMTSRQLKSHQSLSQKLKFTPRSGTGVCYRSFGYYQRCSVKGDFTCANGDKSNTSSAVSFVHTGDRESYSCGGNDTPSIVYWRGSGDGGGGSPSVAPPKTPPGMTPCTPGVGCECCTGAPPPGPTGGGPGGPPVGPVL